MPAMDFDQLFDNGESETAPGVPARVLVIAAKELFKDPDLVLGADPDAGITDFNINFIFGFAVSRGQSDFAARLRIFDGII